MKRQHSLAEREANQIDSCSVDFECDVELSAAALPFYIQTLLQADRFPERRRPQLQAHTDRP
jgi:hypothetical protein